MITDLYTVPRESVLIDFVQSDFHSDGKSIISEREYVDKQPSCAKYYLSITKMHGSVKGDVNTFCLVSNYVVCQKFSTKESESFDQLSEERQEEIVAYLRNNAFNKKHVRLLFYNITLLEESEGKTKDHCIFCNGAFVGINNHVSSTALQIINTCLSNAEIEKAKREYNLLKTMKDSRSGLDFIPKIELFDKEKENKNG